MILFFNFIILICFCFSSNKIVAVVGGDIILESDLEEQISFFIEKDSVPPKDLRENVLDYLIEQKVLVYFAKKDTTLVVDNSQIEAAVLERISLFKNQLGSVEALEKYFGLSFSDIKDLLYKEGENMFLSDQFRKKLSSQVSVSSEEVRLFYEEYKDSFPLTPLRFSYSCFDVPILPSKKTEKALLGVLDNVLQKILSGEAVFESFYSEFSGGDLGFFKRGDFIKEFEEAAFSLQEGGVVGPVKTSLGFHIIRLNKRVGEKISASHILFSLSSKEEDERFSLEYITKMRAACFSSPGLLDSLVLLKKTPLSGIFNLIPKELVPKEVLVEIASLSEGGVSEIKKSSFSSFFFIKLYKRQLPSSPSLYEHWGYIESFALEKKFISFYKDWYNANVNKVYIKKY